ncbi:hypothetical protein QTP86_005310 [Hemibagrus guttatus]|nr:hypothetical protein QTP86_005310 [Hemibagrus guttatus]
MFLKNKPKAVEQYTGCGKASGIRRATGRLRCALSLPLSRTLVSSGIVTLRELMNVAGLDIPEPFSVTGGWLTGIVLNKR